MFEKKTYNKREIFQKVNEFEEYMHRLERYNSANHEQLLELAKIVRSLVSTNEQLRNEIDILTKITEGNLGQAENCEFLMLKTYRKDPVIFKDGKLLTNDCIKEAHVNWYADDNNINVEIEN